VVTILRTTRKKYQLRLPSQSDNLAIIREFVAKVAKKVGFNSDEASKIELAVDEACTNVIKHAYTNNSNQIIDVQINVDRKKLSIIVSDRGKGFDPAKVKLPDLGESIKKGRKGGLGICLIKTLMDKVDFQIKPGLKNQVKMTKFIN
jgi:serine/threonine-protein kinase RsbW